jgi:hypothetical protein
MHDDGTDMHGQRKGRGGDVYIVSDNMIYVFNIRIITTGIWH